MPDESVTKNLSEAITRTLPFLRRYARAVSGSQQRGDEWVRLCAEVAVRQPELIAKAADTKLGVFKLFHKRPGTGRVAGTFTLRPLRASRASMVFRRPSAKEPLGRLRRAQ